MSARPGTGAGSWSRIRPAARAFALRDLRVGLSYKLPFLLQAVAALFGLLTTWFVAKIVNPGEVPGGYFTFVVLGLLVAVFVSAGITMIGGSLREEQLLGTLEATLSSGVPTGALAIGMLAYPMVSATFEALIYALLAFALGARAPDANWSLALGALILGVLTFTGLGLVGAALVLVLQRASGAVAWMVAVLSLAAGEFFPPRLMPGWLQGLALLSPFTWCLRLIRAAVLEDGSWSGNWRGTLVLAAMSVVWVFLGGAALAAGLRAARRRGTLGGY